MIKADNLTLIGQFSVDSGQAIVGDPCYLDEWKNWDRDVNKFEDHENSVGEYGYLGACNATLKKGFGQLGGANAVAFSTGYGDGLYPVYANITEDGRVGLVVIDFTGEYDEEDN
jgi:hypothetical protein